MSRFRLFDLNDPQRAAVTQTEGPVLILAGAGTGKTRVITARIAYLLSQGVDPSQILAVTFTNKAANEMRERVTGMVDPDIAKRITLSTFHALCVRLLRMEIERLGYKKNFSIYDQGDSLGVIKQMINRAAAKDEKLDPNMAQAMISKAKNNGVPPPQDERTLIGTVYARYQKELKRLNAVDFDDLLLLSVQILRDYEDIRTKWRQRFHYLMVDEFQDTNRLQLELVSLLASGNPPNVCVVGDDDQSIYSWRGAEVANILEFERHFPNPTVIKLEQNYRSTNAILHTANSLIRHNPRRRAKQLWSAGDCGEKIQLIPTTHDSDEAAFIVNEIHRRRAECNTIKWSDFAILFRINAQSRPLEEELRRLNIPYKLIGGKSFFDRREVKDVLAYLSCLLNADDDVSLLRIINTPPRGLGATAIEHALKFSIDHKCSLFAAIGNEEFLKPLRPATRAAFTAFVEMLDDYETRMLDVGARYSEVASAWLEEIGYLADLRRSCKTESEAISRERNVYDLLNDLSHYQNRRSHDGLRGFLDELSLNHDRDNRFGEKEEQNLDAVTLITLHAAKGLEFPHVFLVGLEEGILPHDRSRAEGSIDEERRLFYVGITRAMKTLSMSYALTRTRYGSVESRKPSSFLKEIALDHIETVDPKKALNALATDQSAKSHFSRMRAMLTQQNA